MKTFYINLDRDPGKCIRIEDQLNASGMIGERMTAVDGADIPAELCRYFAHSHQKPSIMTPGEVGCYASHIQLFKIIQEQALPMALVLEDDAILDRDVLSVINETLAHLPADWDMVHLSERPERAYKPLRPLSSGRAIVRYSRIPWGTAGYLISNTGARKMLAPIKRVWPIDCDTRRAWVFGMDTYGVVEPPIRQDLSINSSIARRSRSRAGVVRPTQYAWINNPMRSPSSMLFNMRKLGIAWWCWCFAINSTRKISTIISNARVMHTSTNKQTASS